MGVFDNILSAEESLFVNEIALDFDYMPRLIKYREDQQLYLANIVKPLFNKKNSSNVLITGCPGIGKTIAVKAMVQEMEEKGLTDLVIPLYVNCWKKDTPYKIVLELCRQLNYKWVVNKKTDELLKEVANIVNKKAAIIILDEVDKLDNDQIIYQLLEDLYRKSLFLITNEPNWLMNLDQRVKSRLLPEVVEFKPYTLGETLGILQQRVEYAFVKDVWDIEALDLIAQKTFDRKDIRVGLFLLRESGNVAEMKSSRKILLDHAEKAVGKLSDLKFKKEIELSSEEKDVLKMVKANPGSIMNLFSIYEKKYKKSYRTFQRKIKNLNETGHVNINEVVEDGKKLSFVESK